MYQSANKVLIVEDSRAINKMLAHHIATQLHIDVESAVSMQEAKQILDKQSEQFFVAILDLNLPDAPNGEVVDVVLGLGIPPIILTGSMCDDLHDEMLEKPIVDYVIKRNLNEIEYVIETVQRLRENRDRKVLVVDDSRSSRQLLSSLLQRHYLEVLEACDGVEALDVLSENDDILLMVTDYNMPRMDGMELITRVREKKSRNELAIIGISTSGSGTVSIKLLKSGANDFITRPFMHEEFYCRINQNIDAVASYCKLRDAADRDFLTGLFNRKYLFNTGNKLFQNAQRKNISLTVAMIDIDFFKKINDTHGHHVGDMALKHVASIFTQQLRQADVITRFGGEEFCMLCVNVSGSSAEVLFTRFREAIADTPLVVGDVVVPMTVSIGYSMELTDSLDHMISDADAALYDAKGGGRNRVVRFVKNEEVPYIRKIS
ncbi:MAG: diguanylate cyclase [Candidatus Polarisedimenticolaceae bacterium]|nr:diguanylate cyclase [Candidatus Polarisedimenticolaceae bacterium]